MTSNRDELQTIKCQVSPCRADEFWPTNGGHNHYQSPFDRDQPRVTIVIPPGSIDPSRRVGISTGARWAGFFTEISVGTQEMVSSDLSEGEKRRMDPCCRTSRGSKNRWRYIVISLVAIFLVLVAIGAIFGIGMDGMKARFGSGPKSTSTGSRNAMLVGAYYYPWRGASLHNEHGYVREYLSPQHLPTMDEYEHSEPDTIAQHLKWSRQANIGLWIASWWGPGRLEDNLKDVILKHEDLGNMMVALHYETSIRVPGSLEDISSDVHYMCNHYFDHHNYYRVDERPVVFVDVTRELEYVGNIASVVLIMRTAASKCGHNIFLVGDHIFESVPDETTTFGPFLYFDAVTNYDVYGSISMSSPYAGYEGVDKYYSEQADWRASADNSGCRYIPAASPGFNDRGIRFQRNNLPLSRKLTSDSAEGSLFAYQLAKAKELVDPKVHNLLVINSFNQWHEVV